MSTSSVSRSCLRLSSSARRCLSSHHQVTPLGSVYLRTFTSSSPATSAVLPIADYLVPRHHSGSLFTPRTYIQRPPTSTPRRTLATTTTSHSSTPQAPPPPEPAPATPLTNLRTDPETGAPMLITITRRASQRLAEIMKSDDNPALALRITVESGGCHGFQYLMSLTSTTASGAGGVSADEDTVFEAGDGSGAKVVMDEPSLELLKGSKVDYTMELIGSQFKIVDNPLATSSCGCGTSFDVKA
ncbi:MAG: hypothetical protein M1833_001714 [Piccolia ochrophora]|nr:MAG: hypothetical protein M1833_001714 [Piccolia ochrophora]